MVSCKELKEKAPSCFQSFGVSISLPNYAKAYECLWELSTIVGGMANIWYDEALIEKVMLCRNNNINSLTS
jgi:hypothetical protein